MALLTSRALATGVTGTDLIHIVITGDTSQNPAGSSYKAEIDQVKDYLSTFFVNATGNTSGNCITDLYVDNLYGCSPITIHDSLQNIGSNSIGNTSHAFGYVTNSLGDYSHSEGISSTTGQYGYNSTSIVSGVITLDASYGDVTSQFVSQIILDDYFYDGLYGVLVFDINSIIYTTNTIITLVDLSVNTTQAHIGAFGNTFPTNGDVVVGGHYSHSEGNSNSVGIGSHSEGSGSYSVGSSSHSEGENVISVGYGSHAEGSSTSSYGNYSHSEGNSSISVGVYSHAEGESTFATGYSSHAEGRSTSSYGNYSHSEGYETVSIGFNSHSEGDSTKTGHFGYNTSSIFKGTITLPASYGDVTSQFSSQIILDDYLYDNTYGVQLFDVFSVTFNGTNTIITLQDSSVSTTQANIGDLLTIKPSGFDSLVGGYNSHSEGSNTESLGIYTHSEGENSISLGIASHAEGGNTQSLGDYSHSQGYRTKSFGNNSFASGYFSSVYGDNSFVHSNNSTVNGDNSVVLGGSGIVGNDNDTVYVPYLNIRDLGTGTSVNNLGIDVSGNVVIGGAGGSLTPPVTLSGIGMTVLTLIGSGDTVPIFTVQGSSGELFSVTDSLTGSLFSVNDISGLPVVEVFSDNTILMGDYNSPSLNTTIKVTASAGTSTTIYSIPTSAYTGGFFDYTVNSGTNYRAGNIMSIWDGSTAQYIDSYSGGGSPEIGTTSDIVFSVSISGGDANLVATTTSSSWDVKVIVRSI